METLISPFHQKGFTIVPGVLQSAVIGELLDFIDSCTARVDHHREALDGIDPLTIAGSGAEARFKQIIRGDALCTNPVFGDLYFSIASIASAIISQALQPGPREAWNSCLNANLYTRPGDRQGWHIDTNPVSALLFLQSPGDVALVIGDDRHPVPSATEFVVPAAGDLVLLDGTRAHRVSPLFHDRRVNISFNLYPHGAYRRPDQTDGLLYA